jgi:hypothetical protein
MFDVIPALKTIVIEDGSTELRTKAIDLIVRLINNSTYLLLLLKQILVTPLFYLKSNFVD